MRCSYLLKNLCLVLQLDDRKRPPSSVAHLVKRISLDLQGRSGTGVQQPSSDVSLRKGKADPWDLDSKPSDFNIKNLLMVREVIIVLKAS